MTPVPAGSSQLPSSQQTALGLLKAGGVVLSFIVFLWLVPHFLHFGIQTTIEQVCTDLHCQDVSVKSVAGLTDALHRYKIFDVGAGEVVAPVLFDQFPPDLIDIPSVAWRKKIFFHTLLPISLIVGQEILAEREILLAILSKYANPDNIVFQKDIIGWQQKLNKTEISQALNLAKKYKSSRAVELLKKIQPVPVSLILAQSAIESAWGGSRFAQAGNNLFGIWTWNDNDEGLVPKRRENGKTHRVKSFPSLHAAVQEYSLILNSQPAYRGFRKLRNGTSDSIIMSSGLINYSSRRNRYVSDVQNLIRINKLRRYDSCKLRGATNHG